MNERDAETLIDIQLRNLGWIDNPKSPDVNVKKQEKTGKRFPDYVLYDTHGNPLLVIEAKAPGKDLSKALLQGADYAKTLKAPLVFATDGRRTKTLHVIQQKALYLNNEEVDELIRQSLAMKFIDTYSYETSKTDIKSRQELIAIFRELNNSFRDAGVRAGISRVEMFSNLLFLKIISELYEKQDSRFTLKIPNSCLWDTLKKLESTILLNQLNGEVYNHYKHKYGDKEVLSQITVLSGKESILNEVMDRLDGLSFINTKTDIKGDAFEFFLRNYGGSETDFGEYFTPRQVVNTCIHLLDPKEGETIYDPFCGTGGMLICAYKYVYDRMKQNKENIEQLQKSSIYGGEITEIFRIARMNMILAGDGHSNIQRIDSYAHPREAQFDVVVTNIPFDKKMKTEHAGFYGYGYTKSAEITGVSHCLNALNNAPNARAAIIVPEGILFDGSKAYTQLREELVDKCDIQTIVSLPAGVFAPNTGVKSNIILVKKRRNSIKSTIWYFDVRNDGFTLDTARRKIEGVNDLDVVVSESESLTIEDRERLEKLNFSVLDKEEVRANRYILVAKRYQKQVVSSGKFPMVRLGDVCKILNGYAFKSENYTDHGLRIIRITNVQKGKIIDDNPVFYPINDAELVDKYKLFENDLLVSLTGNVGRVGLLPRELLPAVLNQRVACLRVNKNTVNKLYLYYVLNGNDFERNCTDCSNGIAQQNLSTVWLSGFQIPLPPLAEQERIVAELDGYQRIIEGARQIIDTWSPSIHIKDSWKRVKLEDVIVLEYGTGLPERDRVPGDYSVLGSNGIIGKHNTFIVNGPAIIVGRKGSAGEVRWSDAPCFPIDTTYFVRLKDINVINLKYLYYVLYTGILKPLIGGTGVPGLNREEAYAIQIPLPSIEEQKRIVAELETEQIIIEQNKKLIDLMEQKIQKRLAALWENTTSDEPSSS